ncbi:MAG: Uma2 family endonuclease [Pseudanabaena sp.]|jgi:Uma2 family endonuclease|nr:Uma2 family endonuclease [Pseudanabaena sp. M090S1SP2A07QC]MCA6505861.1 Uma2 family endonuclease [Pseudanabaena sp. M172S2SP2A07QC]MCA6511006.1 Uma2 family endonuclease [Pseudanabaena sp. M109S1SP2A07QC]MCA6519302.1 Uma2 family endonuclease [Pseudanabaena sp. M110S1SP2A07QC]MCA6521257.1 Uma2 family endonuclease [Pseudanabaena sp. M051S1SP2A07QC]MCA6525032.1 Uma2 family endonuclease [Pseudanabaena sp. M179S2SP2A07QC]MCA6529526.1 Uma2 family endonuclease [Pseudanabaena sp. M125S2SP2A07QC]MC
MTPIIAPDLESILQVQETQKIQKEIFYPSEDGEPLAETSVHADAIIATVAVLRNYLAENFSERSPVVLADQFLYYANGFPRLRVAPDVMVILDIPQQPYDNYKIWETGKIPSIIFEMTSESTQAHDQLKKRELYESIGVLEYWLFDPKGEWIPEKLRGYRRQANLPEKEEDSLVYEAIADGLSQVLGLRLEVEGSLINFYRQDNGEKLLIPSELFAALQAQTQRAADAQQRAESAEERARLAELEAQNLRDRLASLGIEV